MWLNRGRRHNEDDGGAQMSPARDTQWRRCPVCGAGLPDDRAMRRCPRCGARTLWTSAEAAPAPGVVLFNARLCGIMAGIQVGMIALLVGGYHLPLPWGTVLIVVALPVLGYAIAGEVAHRVPQSSRAGFLVIVVALNAGLLAALIAAILGLLDPVALGVIAAGAGGLLAPAIGRAIRTRP